MMMLIFQRTEGEPKIDKLGLLQGGSEYHRRTFTKDSPSIQRYLKLRFDTIRNSKFKIQFDFRFRFSLFHFFIFSFFKFHFSSFNFDFRFSTFDFEFRLQAIDA